MLCLKNIRKANLSLNVRLVFCTFILTTVLLAVESHAAHTKPLPPYLSLKNTPCNVRVGPGKHFPIDWVFQIKGMPVQVISKYHDWYKIKDVEGSIGWIHKSMLSHKSYALFVAPQTSIKDKPSHNGNTIALINSGVVALLKKCQNEWCEVRIQAPNACKTSGYVPKNVLWGAS